MNVHRVKSVLGMHDLKFFEKDETPATHHLTSFLPASTFRNL